MTKLSKFDAADYLDSEETIAEYLTAALEDENPDVFLAAISDVAKARGMAAIAKSAGLGREGLYEALTPGAKPRYDTIIKVLHGLGVNGIKNWPLIGCRSGWRHWRRYED